MSSYRPTKRDLANAKKLAADSTRITAAQLLSWCDRYLDGEQDYNRSMNVSTAKQIIEQAVREICK